jgi:putative drug exporter of the RND superfamily
LLVGAALVLIFVIFTAMLRSPVAGLVVVGPSPPRTRRRSA